MRNPDIRYKRNVWTDYPSQVLNLPEVIHAHLEHANLRIRRKRQDAQRKSEPVVIIFQIFRGLVLAVCNRIHHVAGASLADAARDSDLRLERQRPEVVACEVLKSHRRILHENYRNAHISRAPVLTLSSVPARTHCGSRSRFRPIKAVVRANA